jgi:hypothetical protein
MLWPGVFLATFNTNSWSWKITSWQLPPSCICYSWNHGKQCSQYFSCLVEKPQISSYDKFRLSTTNQSFSVKQSNSDSPVTFWEQFSFLAHTRKLDLRKEELVLTIKEPAEMTLSIENQRCVCHGSCHAIRSEMRHQRFGFKGKTNLFLVRVRQIVLILRFISTQSWYSAWNKDLVREFILLWSKMSLRHSSDKFISVTIFRTHVCPMKSYVDMQNGLSTKRISKISMQMKQTETVRDFKPRGTLWWDKKNFILINWRRTDQFHKAKVCIYIYILNLQYPIRTVRK